MSIKSEFALSSAERARIPEIEKRWKGLHETPATARPLVVVNIEDGTFADWKARVNDPEAMLRGELENVRNHLMIGDDWLPMVRVQFGTGQVAAAFGAEIAVNDHSLPAALTHPLNDIHDAFKWSKPPIPSGWYGRVKEYTDYFKANLPEGVAIQHPDIQGPFNTAHLIRGDDLFTDFYDNPEGVGRLLDLVTDYMVDLVPWLKAMLGEGGGWFRDWGGLWKGTARISNCSMQMISPEFYMEHVLPRDTRLFKAIGGGRIHYCGRTREVFKRFLGLEGVSGLDYDHRFQDLFELCDLAPERAILMQQAAPDGEIWKKLMAGLWPKKKNIAFVIKVKTLEEGQARLKEFKAKLP